MSSCRIDVSLQRIAANLNGLCSCTRINKGCIALVFVILVFSELWTNSNQGQDLKFGVSKTCKAVSKLKCTIQLWMRPSVFYGLARLQNVNRVNGTTQNALLHVLYLSFMYTVSYPAGKLQLY